MLLLLDNFMYVYLVVRRTVKNLNSQIKFNVTGKCKKSQFMLLIKQSKVKGE